MRLPSLLFLAIGLAFGAIVGYVLASSPTQAESYQVPAWLEVAQRICTSVGGLGSFAALIYVIRQFNLLGDQNQLVQTNIRASLDGMLYARLDSFNKFVVEHATEYDMLAKPFEGVDPSCNRAKLHHLCELAFTFYEQIYKHHDRFHLLETEDWEEWQQNMRHFFAKPYVRGYWPQVRDRFGRQFREHADCLVAQAA
jgi:hypothetical protein